MSELTTSRYLANEAAMSADFQNGEAREVGNISTLLEYLAQSTADVVIAGGTVKERGTPSMNVDISEVLAFCQNTGLVAHRGSDLGPVAIDNGEGSDRIDVIEIRQLAESYDEQPRKFRDPVTEAVSTQDVDTKWRYTIEAQVVKGTAGSGVAPSRTAGWIKLAEVTVPANESTSIEDNDIENVTGGYDGEATANWTTETTATYKLEPLSVLKTLFRVQHEEDGDHSDDFCKAKHLDFGTGAGQVDADVLPLGTDVTNTPTGGTSSNLVAASFVRAALQEIFDRLKDLSGVQDDAIKDRHIDWGTGAEQVSAETIPIVDSGNNYAVDFIEDALAEAALRAKFTVITANTILTPNRKYLVNGSDISLTLPSSPTVGDFVEIYTVGVSYLVQNDAEHSISFMQTYFTTKGVNGRVLLPPSTYCKMVYRGNGSSRVEPFVKLSNPSVLPDSHPVECKFSHNGIYLAMCETGSPYIAIYKRSGDTFTRLSDPASVPSDSCYGISWSPDDTYLAIACNSGPPYIYIYKRSGDTFTKLSDPGTLPTGASNGCSFSHTDNGLYLAVAHENSPYITIYKRSGDTFTKLTNPGTLPSSRGMKCVFSLDDSLLAVGIVNTPYVAFYKHFGDTFTKLADPSSVPSGSPQSITISRDSRLVYVCFSNSPYSHIYERSGDSFLDLTWFTISGIVGIIPSIDDEFIAVSTGSASPYLSIYRKKGTAFAIMTPPASLPSQAIWPEFSPDNKYLAVTNYTSPYIYIYKTVEDVTKAWEIASLRTKRQELEPKHIVGLFF